MPAEILIYGVIGETFFGDGVTAKDVADQLAQIDANEDIRVRINSPGGFVFDGVAIYNLLAERGERVTVDIDALAASAATIVAMAGSKIRMAANAQFMIHKPLTFTAGNADELRKLADILDLTEETLVETYRTRASSSADELRAMMRDETYFSAQQAHALGFVDEITGRGSDPDKTRAQVAQLANLVKRPAAQDLPKVREQATALLHRQRELLLTKLKVMV